MRQRRNTNQCVNRMAVSKAHKAEVAEIPADKTALAEVSWCDADIAEIPPGNAEDIVNNTISHLDLCKDALSSQEARNREFSQKALGIITFSVTLFGFGVRWMADDEATFPLLIWCLVIALGACALIIAFVGIACVIKPGSWKESRRLDYFQCIALQAKHSSYLATLADTHRKAAEANRTTLEARGKGLKAISWIALGQLVIFAALALALTA